jgi:parafibromin
VVAVFTMGKQWQFKDWPFGYGNPSDIFTKIKGYHFKLSGIPLDPNIAKWSVSVIELDPHKRHLDRARLTAFWDELDRYNYFSEFQAIPYTQNSNSLIF